MLTFNITRELLSHALTEKNTNDIIATHFVSRLVPTLTIHEMRVVETNAKILTRVYHKYPSDFVTYKLPEGDFNGYIMTQISNNYSEFYLLGYLPTSGVSNLDYRHHTRFFRDDLKAFGLWNSVEVKRRD